MKEYLDLEIKFLQNIEPLTEEEAQFRQCFASVLAGTIPNDNSRKVSLSFLRQYIRRNYAAQIDGLIEYDLSQTLRRIDDIEVRGDIESQPSPDYEEYSCEKNRQKLERLAIKEYDKHAEEFVGFDAISDVFAR